MKLRLKGNQLRLRLSQEEIDILRIEGEIEERMIFGPTEEQTLSYSLMIDQGIQEVQAHFHACLIRVAIPQKIALSWIHSDQVGIYHQNSHQNQASLSIAIEKDLPCHPTAARSKSHLAQLKPFHSSAKHP